MTAPRFIVCSHDGRTPLPHIRDRQYPDSWRLRIYGNDGPSLESICIALNAHQVEHGK